MFCYKWADYTIGKHDSECTSRKCTFRHHWLPGEEKPRKARWEREKKRRGKKPKKDPKKGKRKKHKR